MVSPEELTARGLAAYQTGRLLVALRVALVVAPLAALSLVERTGRELCACLAVVLLGLAVWLRFRDRRGMEAVTTGLVAGSIPLAAGLVLARLDVSCGLSGAESLCTLFSSLLGVAAGMLVAARQTRWQGRLSGSLAAGGVAVLAAAIGCVRLGVLGVAAMVAGVALGTLLGTLVTKRAPS